MNLRLHAEAQSAHHSLDDSLSCDTREHQPDSSIYAFTEVVSLTGTNCKMINQTQFGMPYHPNDFLIFHVTVAEPENIAYLIDLFAYSSKAAENDPPLHLGYHYVLPNLLKRSEGTLELAISSAMKHRPMGMLTVDYIKVCK